MTQITIFRNIKDTLTPFFRDIDVVLNRIKEGNSKELVKRIRKRRIRMPGTSSRQNSQPFVSPENLITETTRD